MILLQTIKLMGKKLVSIPAQNFKTPQSYILYENKELCYLGTQLGLKFSAFFLQYSKELIISSLPLSARPVCVSAYFSCCKN